jgi:hypothetical protein
MCCWCGRSRLVFFRTWRSLKRGEQLVGEVCDHCFLGGADDGCRTCKRRKEKGMSTVLASNGARPIEAADAARLLESQNEPKRRRRKS